MATKVTDNPLLFKKRSYSENYITYKKQQRYYSGSEVSVYFGPIYIPEITSIQFQGAPKDAPIFGYADENFNAVAKGNYIVSGTIVMSFTETGYLNKAIRTYWSEVLDKKRYTGTQQAVEEESRFQRALETLLNDSDRVGTFKSVKEAKETLKARIWGNNNTAAKSKVTLMYRPDQLTALGEFKDYDENGKIKERYVPPLDMYIIYGNPNIKDGHEVKKLSDVRFLEYGQTINNDGSPIQEVISFVARDMDRPEYNPESLSTPEVTDQAVNVTALTTLMADALFAYIARSDAIINNYDTAVMMDQQALTLVGLDNRVKTDRDLYVIEGKNHISYLILSGFRIPMEYLRRYQIGPFSTDPGKAMNSIPVRTMSAILQAKEDIKTEKFLDSDQVNLLPKNNLLADHITAYIASVMDRVGFINPFSISRTLNIISKLYQAAEDVIENPLYSLQLYNPVQTPIDSLKLREYTNANLSYSRIGTSGTSFDYNNFSMFLREHTRNLDEQYQQDYYLETDRDVKIIDGDPLNVGVLTLNSADEMPEEDRNVTLWSDYLSTKLDTVTLVTAPESEDYIAAFELQAQLSAEGTTLYTVDGTPMSRGITVNREYTYGETVSLCHYESGTPNYWFPVPSIIQSQSTVPSIAVVIDGNLTTFTNGKSIYSDSVNYKYKYDESDNITHVRIDLNYLRSEISPYNLIKIYMTDPTIIDIANYAPKLTFEGFEKYRRKYIYDKKIKTKIKTARNAGYGYVEKTISDTLDSMSQRIYGTRICAVGVIPTVVSAISMFTKRNLKKSVGNTILSNSGYQYMFDFQSFVDTYINDLITHGNNFAKLDSKYSDKNGKQRKVTSHIDNGFIRKTFRNRFLKNLSGYILPGNVQVGLYGASNRTVLVSVQLNTPQNSVLQDAIVKQGISSDRNRTAMKYSGSQIKHSSVKASLNTSSIIDTSYKVVTVPKFSARVLCSISYHPFNVINNALYKYRTIADSSTDALLNTGTLSSNNIPCIMIEPSRSYSYSTEVLKIKDNILLGISGLASTAIDETTEESVSGATSFVTTMYKEQPSVLMSASATSDVIANILDLITYVDKATPTSYADIAYTKLIATYKAFLDVESWFTKTSVAQNIVNSSNGNQTIFAALYGATGIDKIYGNVSGITGTPLDPSLGMSDTIQRLHAGLRCRNHLLASLKNHITAIKIIERGDSWPSLI